MIYSAQFLALCDEIDTIMSEFIHTKKDIGYGFRRTFRNGQRIDMIDYKQQGTTILRLGRGARFVRTYPVLYGLFDEVAKVIAKITIHDRSVLYTKDILGICALLDKAPEGIGYLD